MERPLWSMSILLRFLTGFLIVACAAGCALETVSPGRGPISSGFGVRDAAGASILHAGSDLPMPVGTPVRAFRKGVVVFVGVQRGYGNVVILSHGDDLESVYAHLSEFRVRLAQKVKAGQIIALSGNTGRTTGPHLHFEVRKDGRPFDSARFLSR
jgi:murein DD-endopeptidase MepM/ murein hydrolase activator NlpD